MAERRQISRTVPFRREAGSCKVFGEVGVPLPRFTPGQVLKRSQVDEYRARGALHYDGGAWEQIAVTDLAERFLVHSRAIDKDHDHRAGVGDPIQSYVAPKEIPELGIHLGGWQLGVDVTEAAAVARMDSGDLTGFSVSMLTNEDVVEIVVEDDEAQADGTFLQERMAITYFVDPLPLMVSLVGKPATGLPFQVVRCVEDGCHNPKCKHTCQRCIDRARTDAAPSAAKENPVKKTTPSWVTKAWNVLRGAAKAEGIEIPELNLVDRQAMDFNAAWAAAEVKEDLRSSFWTFEDVVFGILCDDEIALADKVAAIQASTQQFTTFLGALLKAAEDAVKAGEAEASGVTETAERSVDGVKRRSIGGLQFDPSAATLVARVGKVLSGENKETLKKCLEGITAGAGGIQKFLSDVEAAEAAENRSAGDHPGEEDDVTIREELEAAKAKLAQAEQALADEKKRSEDETRLADELAAAKKALADKEAELAKIRATRPASSAAADDGQKPPARSDDAPIAVRTAADADALFQKKPFFSSILARSAGVEMITSGDEDDE